MFSPLFSLVCKSEEERDTQREALQVFLLLQSNIIVMSFIIVSWSFTSLSRRFCVINEGIKVSVRYKQWDRDRNFLDLRFLFCRWPSLESHENVMKHKEWRVTSITDCFPTGLSRVRLLDSLWLALLLSPSRDRRREKEKWFDRKHPDDARSKAQ